MVLKQISVPLVGTLFGNQFNLRTGRPTLRSIWVRSGHAELFNSIWTNAQNRAESIAGLLFIYVDAIESDVSLVAASAGYVATWRHCRL